MGFKENIYALHSRRALLPEGIREAWVSIYDGKIVAVDDRPTEGIPIHSVGDLVLMPGLIDSHVHINEPGRTEWEGFETATKAAASGGITTLVDMPLNASPVTTTGAAFRQKLQSAAGKLNVNCGFYGGLIPGNADQIQILAKAGVLGIKAFLSPSGIDEFPNVDEADLREAMPIIAKCNLPLLVHSELVSEHPHQDIPDHEAQSYMAWLRSRPTSWENDAIQLLIQLSRTYSCRTHIVHLSSAEALPMLKAAIEEGLPLTVETCPHYLVFCAEEIPDRATLYKCAPPIREKKNNEQLWEGLRSGIITMVVTDHSPATEVLKGLDHGRYIEAWGGIASLQFSLAATWTEAQKRGFGLQDISRWMSENVADFLGLSKSKGRIQTGFDADLFAWDPEGICKTGKADIHHRNPVSPYTGMQLKGNVHQTWVNGKMVFDQGKFPNLGEGKIILRNQ